MIFNAFKRGSKLMQKPAKLKNFLLFLLSNDFVEIIKYCLESRQTIDDPHCKKCRKESVG